MGKFLIQRSPFHREHTLVITPDVIEYDTGNGNEEGMVRIKKAEIVDVKHTTEAITWGGASLGRKFCVDIKCTNNSTLSVVFNSYFSLKPEYIRTYFKMLRNLWDYYLRDLAEQKRERFLAGETLIFGKVKVTSHGIEVPVHGLTINWSDLVLVEERSFFVLSNQYAPDQSIRVPFNEWGSEVLCALVSTILKRASVETPARVRDLV